MKNLAIILSLGIFVGACASHSPYKAASNSGYGYTETKIDAQRYRVVFKSRGNNKNPAMDYALLRAAELTLQQGYDWFEVVDRHSAVLRHRRDSRPSISASTTRHTHSSGGGLLGLGSQQVHYDHGTSAQLGFGDERSKIEAQLEIWMDKGVRPDSLNAYSALEIANTLGQQLSKSE